MTDPTDPVEPEPVEPVPHPVVPEPAPDGETVPEGVPWSAAAPHVLAILHAQAARIDALTARLDAIDPPQEAP